MNENIIALYEMGAISTADEKEALDFCRRSKIGEHKCSVATRHGWSCDICLESELLKLWLDGVHTINSCCGHGDPRLASILTVGEESKKKMEAMGYDRADDALRMSRYGQIICSWAPKSKLIYNELTGGNADERKQRTVARERR